MGRGISKMIPLWIKSPIAVLAQQAGRLPLEIVGLNMHRSYLQARQCPQAKRRELNQKIQDTIYRYLSSRYGSLAAQVLAVHDAGTPDENAPIWIFWWQGREKAPYIIRSCMEHVCKNAGSHPVRVVDESNYLKYASIPDHIMEKFAAGKISVTHLSDYLRVELLSRYGGLWIDGSVFVQRQIPESVFSQPVWTIRNPGKDPDNISGWNWTIGVMGGWRGNALFCTMAELLSSYWKDHDLTADYFVMDYLMKITYDRGEAVRAWIGAVAPNNDRFYYLQDNANRAVDAADFHREMEGNTWMYKISWKGQYDTRTPGGAVTAYGHWQREYGLPVQQEER